MAESTVVRRILDESCLYQFKGPRPQSEMVPPRPKYECPKLRSVSFYSDTPLTQRSGVELPLRLVSCSYSGCTLTRLVRNRPLAFPRQDSGSLDCTSSGLDNSPDRPRHTCRIRESTCRHRYASLDPVGAFPSCHIRCCVLRTVSADECRPIRDTCIQ